MGYFPVVSVCCFAATQGSGGRMSATVTCTHAHTSQMNIVLFLGMSSWPDLCFLLMLEIGGLLLS